MKQKIQIRENNVKLHLLSNNTIMEKHLSKLLKTFVTNKWIQKSCRTHNCSIVTKSHVTLKHFIHISCILIISTFPDYSKVPHPIPLRCFLLPLLICLFINIDITYDRKHVTLVVLSLFFAWQADLSFIFFSENNVVCSFFVAS